jgi:hypothetical protein
MYRLLLEIALKLPLTLALYSQAMSFHKQPR